MNSVERKAARYRRRQERRCSNKEKLCAVIDSFEYVYMFWWFCVYSLRCCNGVRWKASVQRFELHLISNTYKTKQHIIAGVWYPKRASHFLLFDAGRLRQIDSVNIHTRAVQCTLCYRCIMPIAEHLATSKGFAARIGFGTEAAIKYFAKALRESNPQDIVWMYDFSKFFASIQHEPVKQILYMFITDAVLRVICDRIFGLFGERGLQLGSHFSQCLAIVLGAVLDNMVAAQLHCKYNGRYSDDGFIIIKQPAKIATVAETFAITAARFGLSLNTKKTSVCTVAQQHVFLKKRFKLVNGATLVRLPKQSASKLMRRLRRLFVLYDKHAVGLETIILSYNAWIAYAYKLKSETSRRSVLRFMIGNLDERSITYEVKRHYLLGLPGDC